MRHILMADTATRYTRYIVYTVCSMRHILMADNAARYTTRLCHRILIHFAPTPPVSSGYIYHSKDVMIMI